MDTNQQQVAFEVFYNCVLKFMPNKIQYGFYQGAEYPFECFFFANGLYLTKDSEVIGSST